MDEEVKKLLILQLQESGISRESHGRLSESEKQKLTEENGRFYLKESKRKKARVVLTGGVFDVLHIGHIVTLTEARKEGDILVVAVAADHHIRKKNREPVHPQEYRRVMVESLKMVDVALAGFDNPQDMIEIVRPDVIVYGYDQTERFKPEGVEIVKLHERIEESKFKTEKILKKFDL